MERFKLGIIGLRLAGNTFHAQHLALLPKRVDLSICDINEQILHQTGDENNIAMEKRYTDYRAMIKKEKPQAIIVSMAQYGTKGNNFNASVYFSIVNEMLDMNIPVMVEKPMAMTPAEALPLVEKAKKKKVLTMVNVNRRFNPLLRMCLERVAEHGPVLTANCHFFKGTRDGQNDTDWLTGDMIHALDLLRYICGSEVIDLSGAVGRLAEDTQPTSFQALLRFQNGTAGTFSSNVRAGGRRELWQIHGRNISAYISTDFSFGDQRRMKAGICEYPPKIDNHQFNNSIDLKEYWDYAVTGSYLWQINRGFREADLYFMECVEKKIKPHCDFEDNYKTLECCEAILRSPIDVVKLPDVRNKCH